MMYFHGLNLPQTKFYERCAWEESGIFHSEKPFGRYCKGQRLLMLFYMVLFYEHWYTIKVSVDFKGAMCKNDRGQYINRVTPNCCSVYSLVALSC